MIYFDIDGCFRDLEKEAYGEESSEWNELHNGMKLLEYIEKDPYILLRSPETEYCEALRSLNLSPIRFITAHKKPLWQYNTLLWIKEHFGTNVDVQFSYNAYTKMNKLKDEDFLVEDFPKFKEETLKRIILIDKKYNRGCVPFIRITNPDQFIKVVRELNNE